MVDLWNDLHHLFEKDDGSLPDIFIEYITDEEKDEIYSWVMSLTQPCSNSMLWSIKENRDVPVNEIDAPVRQYIEGNVESFRHGLEEFKVDGTTIPQLSICIGDDGLEFDYRMGKGWGLKEVEALFIFLSKIKNMAPKARIFQAYEGGYKSPNPEFTEAFEKFYVGKYAS